VSFQLLQQRMHMVPSRRLVADVPVMFVAFDPLWLDGVVDLFRRTRLSVMDAFAPP
jgi:ATP-dependent DNA ligase